MPTPDTTADRSPAMPAPLGDVDDRITCDTCKQADGPYCRAAQQGLLRNTSRMASPMPSRVPWRCEGYTPDRKQADQRTGAQRWPGL